MPATVVDVTGNGDDDWSTSEEEYEDEEEDEGEDAEYEEDGEGNEDGNMREEHEEDRVDGIRGGKGTRRKRKKRKGQVRPLKRKADPERNIKPEELKSLQGKHYYLSRSSVRSSRRRQALDPLAAPGPVAFHPLHQWVLEENRKFRQLTAPFPIPGEASRGVNGADRLETGPDGATSNFSPTHMYRGRGPPRANALYIARPLAAGMRIWAAGRGVNKLQDLTGGKHCDAVVPTCSAIQAMFSWGMGRQNGNRIPRSYSGDSPSVASIRIKRQGSQKASDSQELLTLLGGAGSDISPGASRSHKLGMFLAIGILSHQLRRVSYAARGGHSYPDDFYRAPHEIDTGHHGGMGMNHPAPESLAQQQPGIGYRGSMPMAGVSTGFPHVHSPYIGVMPQAGVLHSNFSDEVRAPEWQDGGRRSNGHENWHRYERGAHGERSALGYASETEAFRPAAGMQSMTMARGPGWNEVVDTGKGMRNGYYGA
ncbi:hypothetical protein AURDEDRAFT_125279 [Auricularia subglabra TFB-10046 SS5]|nr:hypothetical protein AURDEDRAFT_125279 [Auricularia subglabra TFB-10046 SS5]